jgi:hypothetical protein
MASYLPNVFHYRTEQRLYNDGHEARGLVQLQHQTQVRIESESVDLDARIKRRDLTFVLAGIFLAVLAGAQTALAQARQVLPYYVLPSVALAVVIGALIWVRRL